MTKQYGIVLAACILTGGILQARSFAAISDLHIGSGETVKFSDDFDNNNAGWATSGTNSLGTFGGTQLTQTVWQPVAASDGTSTQAIVTIPGSTTVKIADGPINIYYRVAVQYANGANNNRFEVVLKNSDNKTVGFVIAPNSPSNSKYEWTGSTQAITEYLSATTAFVSYRLTLSANSSGTTYTLSLAKYDTTAGAYQAIASTASTIPATALSDGSFSTITIFQRNGSSSTNNYADYFDAIAITQPVPEPAALGALGTGMAGMLLLRKR